MSNSLIMAKGEEFSAYATVKALLTSISDEAESKTTEVALKGFNVSQANAVFYLLAYAMATASTHKATGPAEKTTNAANSTANFIIPNVGALSSQPNAAKTEMVISLKSFHDAIPIHAMRAEIKESKKFFGIANQQSFESGDTHYNMLICPDQTTADNMLMLMQPIVRGHGYTSQDDISLAEATHEGRKYPAIAINKRALEYVMKHERIEAERYRQ